MRTSKLHTTKSESLWKILLRMASTKQCKSLSVMLSLPVLFILKLELRSKSKHFLRSTVTRLHRELRNFNRMQMKKKSIYIFLYFWIFLIRGFFLFLFFKESWLGNKAVWLTHSTHLVTLQNVIVQKGEQQKPQLVCTFEYFYNISPTCQNTNMKCYGRGQMLSSVYFTTPIVAIDVRFFCRYLPYIPLYWAVLNLSASLLAGMNLLSSDIICVFIKSARADCRIFSCLHHPLLTQWTFQGCCGLQYECKSPFVIFVKC